LVKEKKNYPDRRVGKVKNYWDTFLKERKWQALGKGAQSSGTELRAGFTPGVKLLLIDHLPFGGPS
jgi:hypothetical protein